VADFVQIRPSHACYLDKFDRSKSATEYTADAAIQLVHSNIDVDCTNSVETSIH